MLFLPLTQDWSVFSVFLFALFLVASKLVQPRRGKNTGWGQSAGLPQPTPKPRSLGPCAGLPVRSAPGGRAHHPWSGRARRCGWSSQCPMPGPGATAASPRHTAPAGAQHLIHVSEVEFELRAFSQVAFFLGVRVKEVGGAWRLHPGSLTATVLQCETHGM